MPVANYQTPDVYVEEISTLPPSIAQVSTAIPAFIGYTADNSLKLVPTRITSFLEFKTYFASTDLMFSGADPVGFNVDVSDVANISPTLLDTRKHKLYYELDMYFKNGGGDCYVVSLGKYGDIKNAQDFKDGIDALLTEDEPTLLIFSEATTLNSADYYDCCTQALAQCAKLQDRFCIFDALQPAPSSPDVIKDFRNNIGINNLYYGAAYYPYLNTSLGYVYDESQVTLLSSQVTIGNLKITSVSKLPIENVKAEIVQATDDATSAKFKIVSDKLTVTISKNKTTAQDIITAWTAFNDPLKSNYIIAASNNLSDEITEAPASSFAVVSNTLSDIKQSQAPLYNAVKQELSKSKVVLPPASAIAGIYAVTDRTRGVWKAPANVSLNNVISPTVKITNGDQESLNVDVTAGKSINAIRSFTGKGTLVWGARTLDGSSNEWRYVSVRRLFIMIEESAKKASYFAVFEPNDSVTWLKVKGMIESFLYGLWQQGAMAGSTSKAAYYVNVGLGTTMTPQDILEGRMIVEIGIAAVRPAEFIVLRFSHKLQEA